MTIANATDQAAWDIFLNEQSYSPFHQSWTFGEVSRATSYEPIRLQATENGALKGICQAFIVPARRGRHLWVPYGPIVHNQAVLDAFLEELRRIAKDDRCHFLRISPFWPDASELSSALKGVSKPSPLHVLGEHVWYLPLQSPDVWSPQLTVNNQQTRSKDDILKDMRKNTRNLIRRAEREGVTVEASQDPLRDLDHFIRLHEETRKRHHFVPYTNDFFRAQVGKFAPRGECTLYLARYQGEILASSIHMHTGGETSYHHGASTLAHPKIPASYLLQWTAITDALERGDHVYSFWGIAPEGVPKHPFAGVTTFKKGFGGELLELVHCQDIPLHPLYTATRAFEQVRKWKRGF